MRLEHDLDADAVYVWLREGVDRAFGERLDDARYIDYGEDNLPIGIEFLGVRSGVDTEDLPERAAIQRLLGEQHIKEFA